MKLVICSILFGLIGTSLSEMLLSAMGNQVSGSGVVAIGILCFFCPSIYTLNKIYDKIKNE